MAFLVSSGLGRHSGRRSAIAGAVVAGECLVFAANGLRCPLTDLAESWGAERGKITDSYLPSRFAHALPAIHAPVLILVLGLHRRRLYRWAQSNASWRGSPTFAHLVGAGARVPALRQLLVALGTRPDRLTRR